jgi:hypothetical protein
MAQSMSLQDMRDFVREHLDSDDEELPDSLVDRFIYNGSNKVETYSRTWDFRAVEYAFTTTTDTREYDLDSHADLTDPAPLADVVAIQGDSYELKPQDHRKMRLTYPPNSDSAGSPLHFTKWGRTLYLWPTPSSAIDYTVVGYRQGRDWISLNLSPDFPNDLHELIAWWALNRAYVFLDDPELADFYREEFDRELRIRSRPYLTGLDAQPFQINGGMQAGGSVRWANRARYDWE